MNNEADWLAADVLTAGRKLGIGRTKVYEEIKAGRLKTITVGRRRLITREALTDYLALLSAEADS